MISADNSLTHVQFSRNMFRDTPDAFAFDGMALVLSQTAIAKKFDAELEVSHRAFLYMPFMHSESILMHDIASQLFSQPGMEEYCKAERKHRDLLERFGRYPHRNLILGRKNTSLEEDFFAAGGTGF